MFSIKSFIPAGKILLAYFVLNLSLGASLTFANDESLDKEGRLIRNPAINNPTSEIDWVITHENNTEGLMENVILTFYLWNSLMPVR